MFVHDLHAAADRNEGRQTLADRVSAAAARPTGLSHGEPLTSVGRYCCSGVAWAQAGCQMRPCESIAAGV